MSITRLQQARQMYAMGQRVGRIAFGGGGSQDHHGGGYQGSKSSDGPAGGASSGGNYGGNQNTEGGGGKDSGPDNPGDQGSFNPETGTTSTKFGSVPGVDYGVINNPDSQYNKNIRLDSQLRTTPFQSVNTPFMSLNLLGNTLGKFGYNKNTKFFSDNSIGGKINPATGKPFGYGIDGYNAYMEQRLAGNVGAYGGTELSQNEINKRAGEGDSTQGIMNVLNNQDYGDEDGDGDVDEDDFIFKYFDKTGETLQAGAGGVQDLMSSIRERISNLFS